MSSILRFKNENNEWVNIPALVGKKGVSITAITKVGTVELVDTYRVDYSDGTNTTFEITNGAKGDQGDKGDVDFVAATTLNQGQDATVTKTVDGEGKVTLTFGIPKGSASATIIDWGDEE